MSLNLPNKAIFASFSAIFFVSAMADAADTTPYPPTAVNNNLTQQLCPPIEALTRNLDNTWSAPGGWKSHSPSFLNSVTQFVGAQWIGVNLGEVICIYTKSGKNRFPINLQRPNLVVSPVGGGWTADKGGYKDCISNDPKQCRFFTPQPEKHGNIYDEIDFYKGKPLDSSY
ncbi:MAG TPA: T4SS-associated protein EirA [Gammaproteobacteria bacterium]|nr:T4SS-associated protein EirA [Gammaproteobacteria bacterium]